jgi:hypothetical protein
MYPRRSNKGITPPHRGWWWSRWSQPQGCVELDVATTSAQRPGATKGAPLKFHTHTMNDDDIRISDPYRDCRSRSVWIRSGISAAWWCVAMELTFLLRNSSGGHTGERERERGEEAHGREAERCSQHMRSPPNLCLSFFPHGVPLYRRRERWNSIQLAMWD